MLYFSSDPHYNHEKMLELRGFNTLEEMNNALIKGIHKAMHPTDTLVYLGDISFGDKENTYSLLSHLKCKKVLVKGNHDSKKIQAWDIWDSVHDYLEVKEDGQRFCLFHFPIEDWNKKHYGSIHLHGHCHNSLPTYSNRMDVGVDNPLWDFMPVNGRQIVEKTKHLPIHGHVGHHTPENIER